MKPELRTDLLVRLLEAQRAMNVLTRDPRIRAWLEAHDPQALQQVERASQALEDHGMKKEKRRDAEMHKPLTVYVAQHKTRGVLGPVFATAEVAEQWTDRNPDYVVLDRVVCTDQWLGMFVTAPAAAEQKEK